MTDLSFLKKKLPTFSNSYKYSKMGGFKLLHHPAFVSNYSFTSASFLNPQGNIFKSKITSYNMKVKVFLTKQEKFTVVDDKLYIKKIHKQNLTQIVGAFYPENLDQAKAELEKRLKRLEKIEVSNSKIKPMVRGFTIYYWDLVDDKKVDKLRKEYDGLIKEKAALSKEITNAKLAYNKSAKEKETKVSNKLLKEILEDKELKTKLITELKKELNAKPEVNSRN